MSDRSGSATPAKLKVDDNNAQQAAEGGSAELTAVVDDLLNQLSNKFSHVSSELLAKMDEMSSRLDNLEAVIQAGGPKNEDESSK